VNAKGSGDPKAEVAKAVKTVSAIV
ncbi:MAG: hypothetical protein QOF44_6031, partial [Streptomyces sp.]|nr:hypothetical protein [Streptomyces sp.]